MLKPVTMYERYCQLRVECGLPMLPISEAAFNRYKLVEQAAMISELHRAVSRLRRRRTVGPRSIG